MPIVKYKGKCRHPAKQKFCPYWMAKHSCENVDSVLGFRCSLFDEDKEGYGSLAECNAQYGSTYEGPP
jgi:hypothetical protein